MESIKKFFEKILILKRKRGKKLIVCPRCGSFKIHFSNILDGWVTPPQYVCDACGYRGPIVMEVDKDEFEQHLREFKKLDKKA